jgi:hypothetical protein
MKDKLDVGTVGKISETYLAMYPHFARTPNTKYVIVSSTLKMVTAASLKDDAEGRRMFRDRYGSLKEYPVYTLLIQPQDECDNNPNRGYMLSQFGFQNV